MNKDRVEGKVKDVAGRVAPQAGEWSGDPKKQVEGAAKQVEGKLQNAYGKVTDAAQKQPRFENTGKTDATGSRVRRRVGGDPTPLGHTCAVRSIFGTVLKAGCSRPHQGAAHPAFFPKS
jgi:uncharacterized protein YjbJ (UPF0337 family)